jgi:GTP-binding protein Era
VNKYHFSSSSASTTTTQQSNNNDIKQQRRRLDVAIVGAPNAGKSQLLNVLTKSPIAAVSRKRHTTRSDLLGARTIDRTQIVFKDTPGFMRIENAKEERLDRDLIVTAAAEMQDVDYTLLVVDSARTLTENYRQALIQLMICAINSNGRIEETYDDEESNNKAQQIEKEDVDDLLHRPKFAIVLNKVDLVKPKSNLLDVAMDIGSMADICLEDQFKKRNKLLDFRSKLEISPIVFYVSALKEDGTEDILEHLVSLATPCTSWPIEPGKSTNLTPLEQVQEIIREKVYRSCHEEVPHSVQQVNRLFRKVPRGLVIHQDLVVFTKSHQKLVLGSSGMTLQRIHNSARKDLQKAFGCDVALQLHVKLSKSKHKRDRDYSNDYASRSIEIK